MNNLIHLESTENGDELEEIIRPTDENDLNTLKMPSLDDVCFSDMNYIFKINQCDTYTPEFNQLCTPTTHSRYVFPTSPLDVVSKKFLQRETGIPSISPDLFMKKEMNERTVLDNSPLNHHSRSKSLNLQSKIYRPTMIVPLDEQYDFELRKPEPSPPEFTLDIDNENIHVMDIDKSFHVRDIDNSFHVMEFEENQSQSSLQIAPFAKHDLLEEYKQCVQLVKTELQEVTEIQNGIYNLLGRFPEIERSIDKYRKEIQTNMALIEYNDLINVS